MSGQKFSFVDDSARNLGIKTRKHRRKKNPLHITGTKKPPFDTWVENEQCEEGTGSLTYSSSSQAGESTDSSITEIEDQLEMDQKYQQKLQQQRGVKMHRKFSNTSDSLNYSEDDDASFRRELRDMTGQSSNGYGHDGGGNGLIDPKFTSPPTATAFHKASTRHSFRKGSSSGKKQPLSKRQPFSPTMVPSDVSLSSQGTNTPSSPPPRYSKRMSPDHATEVWYAKWWMCGFTDALNINANY